MLVVGPVETAWVCREARTPSAWVVLNHRERLGVVSVVGMVAAEGGR